VNDLDGAGLTGLGLALAAGLLIGLTAIVSRGFAPSPSSVCWVA
jgi:hypothetical protein